MSKMAYEGVNDILSGIFKQGTFPTLYLGLFKNVMEPDYAADLQSLLEPVVGDGYARLPLPASGWTIASQNAAHVAKIFTATGAWGNCTGFFICNALSGTSGKLYSVEMFGDGPYAIVSGDTIDITPVLYLQ